MQLLKDYCKSRKKVVLLFASIFILYFITFILFQVSVRVIIYATVLSMVVAAGFGAWDYYQFHTKKKQLKGICHQSLVSMDMLPANAMGLEEEYEKIIGLLLEEKQKKEREQMEQYTEMLDYYTVWVHQIKTPIASMRLILQEQDSDACRDLKMELQEIEQYVEMVLCYLRLDSDSTDYVFKEYDLDQMIRREVKKLAPQFIGKKLRLEYEDLDRKVLTDEKWLAFVIGQILSNAVKYTKEGSIQIFMEESEILCIRDTGIGIAPEDLPRIFEKGYTGFNGRVDKKASGIGLYLCRRICDNLGHRIWADSVVGQGTYVKIDLHRERLF